jgi:hypothetical protein
MGIKGQRIEDIFLNRRALALCVGSNFRLRFVLLWFNSHAEWLVYRPFRERVAAPTVECVAECKEQFTLCDRWNAVS